MRHAMTLSLGLALALGVGCDKKDAPAQPPATPAQVAPSNPAAPADPAAAPTTPTSVDPGATVAAAPAAAPTRAEIGKAAPDFTLTDIDGQPFRLADHKGKTVVLEWYNSGCPFVVYAYEQGPLKDQAKKARGEGIVWVNINSGAPGKQGHGDEANRSSKAKWGFEQPVLVDEDGRVGRMYDAKTTPHMYVINGDGVLVYAGGLDNAPMGRLREDTLVNYVTNALADVAAGRPVATPEADPYGCSVKY